MKHKIKMPKLGDTTEFVVVEAWEAEVGAVLGAGDILMSVDTDKANADVPTPMAGRLVEKLVAEGDEVPLGAPIATLETI